MHASDVPTLVVELEARPGPWHIGPHYTPLDGWMYNGDVPGPLIRARLGDMLLVRLTNRLPEPTALAVSGPATLSRHDGAVLHRSNSDSLLSQPMVQPQRTAEYRFALTRAGTFWYHAGGSVRQIEQGLHGALIVRDDEESFDAERIIVLDDVRFGRRGAEHGGCLSRRMGDVLLMNGRVQPQLVMAAGAVERWSVINVAHARPVHLYLGGARFRRIDRSSNADAETGGSMADVEETLFEPGDAGELIVGPFPAGTCLPLQALPHGMGSQKLASVFGTVLSVGPHAAGRCGAGRS